MHLCPMRKAATHPLFSSRPHAPLSCAPPSPPGTTPCVTQVRHPQAPQRHPCSPTGARALCWCHVPPSTGLCGMRRREEEERGCGGMGVVEGRGERFNQRIKRRRGRRLLRTKEGFLTNQPCCKEASSLRAAAAAWSGGRRSRRVAPASELEASKIAINNIY